MPGVSTPASQAEAESSLSAGSCVINFCAEWAEPCAQLNTVFAELSAEHANLTFLQVRSSTRGSHICAHCFACHARKPCLTPQPTPPHSQLDADAFPELCDRFKIESVPAFLFLHAGALTDSVMGVDVPTLVNKVKQHNLTAAIAADATVAPPAAPAKPPLDERLRALTHEAPVMLFMKGNPEAPRCGFSRQAVEMLRGEGVAFGTFDILSDEEVRQGLKAFSNWPTYPQLYADGKLLGGLDIMKELKEEDELASSLPAAATAK